MSKNIDFHVLAGGELKCTVLLIEKKNEGMDKLGQQHDNQTV